MELPLASMPSAPLYLFESSRTSGQGTLVKCCPPRAPFPVVSLLGESGDWIPPCGLKQGGEVMFEDHPLLGLVGQDSCLSKDPRPIPLKPRELWLLSAQDRRSPLALLLLRGLGDLSAKLDDKDRWYVWAEGGQGPDGEDALELCSETDADEDEAKVVDPKVVE